MTLRELLTALAMRGPDNYGDFRPHEMRFLDAEVVVQHGSDRFCLEAQALEFETNPDTDQSPYSLVLRTDNSDPVA